MMLMAIVFVLAFRKWYLLAHQQQARVIHKIMPSA